eukprot:9948882-Ditylum_brightwellii.AAC.1
MGGSLASFITLDSDYDEEIENNNDNDEEKDDEEKDESIGKIKRGSRKRVLLYDFNPLYTFYDEKTIESLLTLPGKPQQLTKTLPKKEENEKEITTIPDSQKITEDVAQEDKETEDEKNIQSTGERVLDDGESEDDSDSTTKADSSSSTTKHDDDSHDTTSAT